MGCIWFKSQSGHNPQTSPPTKVDWLAWLTHPDLGTRCEEKSWIAAEVWFCLKSKKPASGAYLLNNKKRQKLSFNLSVCLSEFNENKSKSKSKSVCRSSSFCPSSCVCPRSSKFVSPSWVIKSKSVLASVVCPCTWLSVLVRPSFPPRSSLSVLDRLFVFFFSSSSSIVWSFVRAAD